MAMLGKRSIQRTISMSQIGPGSSLHTDHKTQAHPSAINPADPKPLTCTPDSQKLHEQLLLQAATHQWEALLARQQAEDHHHHTHHHHHLHLHLHQQQNPWEALKGISPSQADDYAPIASKQSEVKQISSPNQWELLKEAETAIMTMLMQQSGHEKNSAGSKAVKDEGVAMGVWTSASPIDVPHKLPASFMGLWPQFASPVASPSSFSRSHFLHSCFLCKQHLGHERDIFIYRGDTAFCSEDCRQRQILTDDLRATMKGVPP